MRLRRTQRSKSFVSPEFPESRTHNTRPQGEARSSFRSSDHGSLTLGVSVGVVLAWAVMLHHHLTYSRMHMYMSKGVGKRNLEPHAKRRLFPRDEGMCAML